MDWPALSSPQPPAYNPPPFKEEESDFLGNVMGGVQYLGETLGKPAAAVQGLVSGLTGGTGEQAGVAALKNLIPFSDTMGITDPKKRIAGSDLLEQWGMIPGKNHEGFDPTDTQDWVRAVSGFVLDLAMDPPAWTGLGTLSKAGKAAAAARRAAGNAPVGEMLGKLASGELPGIASETTATLAEQFAKGERKLFNVHKPFDTAGKNLLETNFGLSPETVGKAVDWLSQTRPARVVKGLFSADAAGKKVEFGKLAQRMGERATAEEKLARGVAENFHSAWLDRTKPLYDDFSRTIEELGGIGDQSGADEILRFMADHKGSLDPEIVAKRLHDVTRMPASTSIGEVVAKTAGIRNALHDYADDLVRMQDDLKKMYVSYGGTDPGNLEDLYVRHAARQSPIAKAESKVNRVAAAKLGGGEDMMRMQETRRAALRDAPGGTVMVDNLARDPLYMGYADDTFKKLDKKEWVKKLQAETGSTSKSLNELRDAYAYKKHIDPALDEAWGDAAHRSTLLTATGKEESRVVAQGTTWEQTHTYSTQKAAWSPGGGRAENMREFLDYYAPEQINTRWNDILDKVGRDTVAGKKIGDALEAMQLSGGVLEHGIFGREPLMDAMSYSRAMLNKIAAVRKIHTFLGEKGLVGENIKDGVSLMSAWKESGLGTEGLRKFVRDHYADKVGEYVAKGLDDDTAADVVAAAMKTDPNVPKALHNAVKLTTPAVKNQILSYYDKVASIYKQALYSIWPQSHLRDAVSSPIKAWMGGKADLMGRKGILANSKLAADYAAKRFDDPHFAEYITFEQKGGPLTELIGEEMAGQFEKIPTKGVLGTLKSDLPKILGGEGGHGKNIQSLQNFIDRAGYYKTLRQKGFAPAEAMEEVRRAHFDYSEMSKFEKEVMKRVAPFYGFTRKMVPYLMSNVLHEPGGRAAQTVRAVSNISSQEQPGVYTPAFMQESNAIGIPGEKPESQGFIKSTILPIGDLNDFVFDNGAPDIGRSVKKMLGRLNPLLLAPVEAMSGEQMSTGRKIEDLEGVLSRTVGLDSPLIDRFIHYSPLSRVEGVGAMLFDPRKSASQKALTLSGMASVSDYDTERWKLQDLRDRYAEILERNPKVRSWKNYYLPTLAQERMAPEDVATTEAVLRRRQQMTEHIKNLSKKRKAEQAQ